MNEVGLWGFSGGEERGKEADKAAVVVMGALVREGEEGCVAAWVGTGYGEGGWAVKHGGGVLRPIVHEEEEARVLGWRSAPRRWICWCRKGG